MVLLIHESASSHILVLCKHVKYYITRHDFEMTPYEPVRKEHLEMLVKTLNQS